MVSHLRAWVIRICLGFRHSDFGFRAETASRTVRRRLGALSLLPAACFLALFTANLRADEEANLIATLQSGASATQKCNACQRLKTLGTVKAVPALAALLVDEPTAHAARNALETMPFPEAGAALREALGRSMGLVKVGLIDSLGSRREPEAVALLTPLLSDSDALLASAAARALGKIGGPDALAALSAAHDKAPAPVQPALAEALCQCGEKLLAGGDFSRAGKAYQRLFDSTHPPHLRAAAWRGLMLSDPSRRAEAIAKVLTGADRPLQLVALQLLRELPDPQVSRACVARWDLLPVAAQLAVLDAQRKLGAEALPTVLAATQSPRLAVRVAAWQALSVRNDPSTIPALASAAAHGEPAERDAARDTLARLRGPDMREALVRQIDAVEPLPKAELLRALGARGDPAVAGVLLRHVEAEAEPVRLAALESLQQLAVADTLTPLLDLAARSTSEAGREPVLRALYAVCEASEDKGESSRRVLAAWARFPASARRQVLPLLAQLGTPEVLQAALAAMQDPDAELAKEAVRVLAQWPNAAPAASLLEQARRATDPTVQTLALRGCIAVVAQETDVAQRWAILQEARAVARRPEEKKQALGQIARIPTPEALQLALKDLADPDLTHEAALASITIAEKLAPGDPKRAGEVASQVLARCKAADVVKRAWALRGKPSGSGPFIRDWQACGLYRQPGVTGAQGHFNLAFGPETAGAAVSWKPVPRADLVNLAALFPGEMNCVAYLRTRVVAPRACDALLLLGSDDGVKAWLNGEVVHSQNVDRGAVPDQDAAPIQLKPGLNDLLLKITQGGGGWAACARIAGWDGQPIEGLRVQGPAD
jgi:HEAT repeat protein